MDVPGDFVEDRLEHVDGDEAHSGFDQAARQQAALAEAVHAVFFAHGFGLAVQFEGRARLRGGHQRVGLMEGGIEQARVLRGFELADRFVDHLAPVAAAVDAQGGQVIGRQHVRDLEIRIGGVGVEDERVVRFAQVAGVLAVRHVAAGVADGARAAARARARRPSAL